MTLEHEYALLGDINRSRIGRYIGIAAASISAVIVLVILTVVDVAKALGWSPNLPPVVLSWVSAGAVYAVLYWLFDRHVWKLPWLSGVLRVPDLSGQWHCDGQTVNPDKTPGYVWQGTITIVQSWDRLRVRLKTKQSGSNSIAAALVDDQADGFRLMYNYTNEPNINEPELAAHRGFADLTFSKDLQTAEGEYFNGHGRFTFGIMKLRRKHK
jgi:SMODS-associating 2TM, beta-strand rich effector domain